MKALTKAQVARLEALQAQLTQTGEAVETAYADLATRIQTAWEETADPAVAAYNAVVEAFNEFRAEVAGDIEGYIGDRSEKWQESDRGEAYNTWLAAWEQELDVLAVDPPECPDPPDILQEDDYPTTVDDV